tara:strand:+ start:139 stop:552 length:414 start_codon:yes stop_codon:yes gene_type:complete
MTGYVPQKFGLTRAYSEGTCVNNGLAYVGAIAVGLDSGTIQEIDEEGIGYFADVDAARDRSRSIHYRNWKETPVPALEFSTEPKSNFFCGSSHGWSWPAGFWEALQAPGSFYSDDLGRRSAVVVPSLGIIAISMQTR